MTTIHVQLDEALYERAKRLAEAEGRTLEAVAADLMAGYARAAAARSEAAPGLPRPEDVIGMWADDPEAVDDMLKHAMKWRRERNERLMNGPTSDDGAGA